MSLNRKALHVWQSLGERAQIQQETYKPSLLPSGMPWNHLLWKGVYSYFYRVSIQLFPDQGNTVIEPSKNWIFSFFKSGIWILTLSENHRDGLPPFIPRKLEPVVPGAGMSPASQLHSHWEEIKWIQCFWFWMWALKYKHRPLAWQKIKMVKGFFYVSGNYYILVKCLEV